MEVLSLCSKQNAPIISLLSYLLRIYDANHHRYSRPYTSREYIIFDILEKVKLANTAY